MPHSSEDCSQLVESSPDGIFISRNGRLAFLNHAAVRLLGASSPEQVLGTPADDIFHPQSRARVRGIFERLAVEPTLRFDERIERLDGTTSGRGTVRVEARSGAGGERRRKGRVR